MATLVEHSLTQPSDCRFLLKNLIWKNDFLIELTLGYLWANKNRVHQKKKKVVQNWNWSRNYTCSVNYLLFMLEATAPQIKDNCLKSVHFKKTVQWHETHFFQNRCHFKYNINWLCFDSADFVLKMTTILKEMRIMQLGP